MAISSGTFRFIAFFRNLCRRALPAALLLAQCGCMAIGNGQNPLSGLWYRSGAERNDTLWVLLPGRYDRASAFDSHGWIGRARDAGVRADIVAVDAYLDYYRQRTVVTRLHEDVIVPARQAGYRRIVLAGVSIGAAGSLRYWQSYPAEVEGVVLIAPYVGEPELIEEIRSAGGARQWDAAGCPPDNICQMWKALQEHERSGELQRSVVLLYGRQDRLAAGHELLAPLLDRRKVLSMSGGHDWSTWSRLWSLALQRGLLTEASDERGL